MLKSLRMLGLAAAASLGLTAAANAYDATVTTDLNMRAGPGTAYSVLDTIPRGALIDAGNCTGNWCRVVFDGRQGWVSGRYLRRVRGTVIDGPRRVTPAPVIVGRPAPGVYPRGTVRQREYIEQEVLEPETNFNFGITIGQQPREEFCYRTQYGDIVCR